MYSYLLFIIIFIFSNKYFYILAIKSSGLFLKHKKQLDIESKESTFFVSLPTNDYKLYTSLPKDFVITYDFKNFLFPDFKGLKVYYQNGAEKKLVFYQKINLDKIDNIEERNLVLSKVMSREYKRELKQDICKKLRERNTKI